jgi:hypothetical protein
MVTNTIGMQGQARTIRDVVAHNHELVSEVFCRKIFRQLLQSLEMQYTMRMPHRAITPDTVVVQENGEPMLLPSGVACDDKSEPADLHALAAVVHFAISKEWPPGAPLSGRRLAGYSDSLLGAIDQCLAPEPRDRPKNIGQLRDLLGIVSLGPPMPPTPARPVPADPPSFLAQRQAPSAMARLQRWALIGAAASVLVLALAGLLALLRGTDAGDVVALSLPPAERDARGLDPNETLVSMPSAPAVSAQAASLPPPPSSPAATPIPAAVAKPEPHADLPPRPAEQVEPRPVRAVRQHGMATTYKLLIKPWGTVYVDGHDRGVSPPLKRLVLPAGQHTVRVVNPNFPDRVLRIDAGKQPAGRIVHDFSLASS